MYSNFIDAHCFTALNNNINICKYPTIKVLQYVFFKKYETKFSCASQNAFNNFTREL